MSTDAPVSLPVMRAEEIAARQVLLTLDASGTSLGRAHTVPGQYARLTFDGVARPMAIASAPSSSHRSFEFLMKVPAERVAPLVALGPDDRVPMSAPQGKGFPLDAARGKSLWLFATGSGIAPLRAFLEHLLPHRAEIRDVSLLYGVRDEAELCFTSRFGAWAGHDIAVIPVVSRPRAWSGRTGHVQDHLPERIPDPANTVAFLCGLPAMDRDVAAALEARGVPRAQLVRNW